MSGWAVADLPTKDDVGPDAFAALDLRVGVVVDVRAFPEARRPAWQLDVDLGPVLGVRGSSAQVTEYPADALLGRRVVCAVNLGARRVAGFRSEVLVLGAMREDGGVALLGVDGELPPGSVVA